MSPVPPPEPPGGGWGPEGAGPPCPPTTTALPAPPPRGGAGCRPGGALGQQVNLLWIVIGAVLVIFMQAGLRARRDRLLPGQARRPRRVARTSPSSASASSAFFLVGYGFMFGGYSYVAAGRRLRLRPRGGQGPRRQRELGVPVEGRLRPHGPEGGVRRRRRRVLPLHGGVHGHHGHHPDRRDGRALEVEELRGLGPVLRRDLLPAVRRVDLGRRLAEPARQQPRPRLRLRRLRRLGRRARHGRRRRPWPAPSCSGPASASTTRRQARTPARSPHPDGDARHVHPAVRLVRVQRRVDVGRHRRPVRRRRRQHGARRRLRCRRRHVLDHVAARASPTPA